MAATVSAISNAVVRSAMCGVGRRAGGGAASTAAKLVGGQGGLRTGADHDAPGGPWEVVGRGGRMVEHDGLAGWPRRTDQPQQRLVPAPVAVDLPGAVRLHRECSGDQQETCGDGQELARGEGNRTGRPADVLGERDQRRNDASPVAGEPGAEQDPDDRRQHAERGDLPQQNRHVRGPVRAASPGQRPRRDQGRVTTWCHR